MRQTAPHFQPLRKAKQQDRAARQTTGSAAIWRASGTSLAAGAERGLEGVAAERYGVAVLARGTRPLIFVDIDGVLIPFRPRVTSTYRRLSGGAGCAPDRSGNPLLDRLDPDHGRQLLALPGELVWASTWMAEANEVIAPRLDLPDLPVVDWPDADEEPQRGMHWKTLPLARWAAGRAFVWLDDEITDVDRRRVAAHHPQPTLLHRVDPYLGLVSADLAAVCKWLRQRAGAG